MQVTILTTEHLKDVVDRLERIESILSTGVIGEKKDWLSAKEMKERFDVCYNTLNSWVDKGITERKKIGSKVFYKNVR